MNFIDGIFLLLLIGMLAVGFFQGMIRLAVVFVAFYLSIVLSSVYFNVVAGFFIRRFGTDRVTAEYVGFALVLMVSFILLTVAGLYTFRYAKMPGQLQYVDRFVGVLLGVLMAGLFIGIFSVLLWDIMVVAGAEDINWPFMGSLGRGVRNSFLLNYFSRVILPETYAVINPILPAAAERILLIPSQR